MRTLLVIKSSLFNGSGQSSKLADDFAKLWKANHPDGRVMCRDLASDPVPHLTAETFSGFLAGAAERSPAQHAAAAVSDALIAELRQADEIVIGLPMYNFTVPSTFKAWMDYVARAGVTFRYTENGPEGLIDDKPLHVLCARGGEYAGTPGDTQTPLIEAFFGMLGIKDVRFVYAEGLALGDGARDTALASAHGEIERSIHASRRVAA
jgi:FMN-dependent NADH-azoreductase